nr:MAG TPA_asm: Cysteine peptidase [Bacteriophage sp.]
MQSEAMVSNATKSTYQKKYKCPYCEGRFTRAKLHIHIQEKHEDLIPEGYTALRVAFNTINNKTEGHCIMCGNVTDWNEDKGRYERLCNDPKCHEAYKKMVAERTKKKYGTERLQTDPEYAEYVQRKALAGRKMHGEYTFADGGKIEYFGSYERKFLQFMDQVMHCESEDILAPAPSIKYQYEGKTHLYIPDFYYIPYNLIIEIKDGGSNPNNHPHRTGEDELKLRAKEEAIRQLNEFSYVRVVNNDFSQVLSIMAVLKYNMAHRYKDPVIKVNESMLLEANPVKVESMSGAIGSAIPLTPNPIPYECDKDNYYIIQHMQNNVFNYSITKDPVQYTMYSVDPEEHGFYKVFKTDKSKISKKYTTFKIKDKQTAKELYDELAMCEAYGKSFFAGEVSRDYIYRRLTEGSKLLSDDQIKYDTRFEQVQSFNEQIQDICEGVRSFILGDPVTRLEEQVSNLVNLNTLHEASTSSSHDTVFSDDATTYVAKVKQAEEAEKNYGLVLIYPDNIVSNKGKEDIDRLKSKYNQYLALNQDKRTISNITAYNIFGYNNDTMYSRLLSKYMNSQNGYTSDNSNMVIAPIDQYYSPTDKIDYSSSDVNVSHEEVVDETSWKRVISELCVRMKNTSDTRQKNAIKSEISMLGWNPEIPFNEEALERVRNSKHTMHIFREVDAEDYIKSIHSFNEATYKELKDKIVPVYICLFSGKALHSRAIEWYTHTEWSHAAMSFDSSMKQMYTFNANNNVSADGKSAGFTIESIEKYWKIDPSIKFKVHALFVTAAQRDMMRDAVDWYIKHQDDTKYSMKTIINIFFKKASDFGNEFKNKTEMVCSQFVYTILAIANLKLRVTKDASLVSPGDLDKSIDDRLFNMFIGGIGVYNSKKIDNMCRKIIPTLPLDKYNIQ